MISPKLGLSVFWKACLKFSWSFPRRILMILIKTYRLFFSPWLGACCRFEPSCSTYALQALESRGAFVGTYLTLHRLVRCNPWCDGGHDPVRLTSQTESRQSLCGSLGPSDTHSPSEKTMS